ncbi:MAG: hypothetical protein O7B35_07620 [Deltaproteobacteria bacterium]|nr:hypothetical protein [Deltaproteobacteria bacterium]
MRTLGLLGLSLILLGEGLSFIHILPWSQYVFPLFWYGYILVLDSLNYRLCGTSLLSDRRRAFLLMLPVSAFYWTIFEWYNLVIQNWVYINTPPEKWVGMTIKIISFATVIPAIYETTDLLGAFHPTEKGLRVRSLIPPNWRGFSLLLGLLLSALPFLLPELFFWSVWLGLFFLIDPINDCLGRFSILRDWQAGDLRRTTLFLLAGYVCGFFWEFWNYWAYTKWIYTVPLPDMPHIFEMPVLGFLGFGPFGVETFAFWTLVWGEKRER